MKKIQKIKWIKKAEIIFLKVKKAVDVMAVVGVFYILLFQIPALRAIGKAFCLYLIDWCVPVELGVFKNIYLCLESFFRLAVILWILLTVILFFVCMIWDWKLRRKTGNNRFEESLFRYLQDKAVSRCFLITGKWGSGKTYEVKRFFDLYYRYSRTKVYRVSCFGLNSRKELVEEINNIIEQGDASVYALIIKVLQFLPIIGEAINKFLKKSYTYTSAKKGSIFIFDDFERITSRTITSGYSGKIYQPTSRFLRHTSEMREFNDIKREFQSVQKSFQKIEDFINKNSLREDYDKYIAVTGLMNELIESFGMKVIVVCNSDILGEKFVHDVLRSKLSCVEYKKVINAEVQFSVLDQVLKSKIFDDEKKQQCISRYLKSVRDKLDNIVQNTEFRDMRLFRGLLEAFMDTAVLFTGEELSKDFLNALFNSIFITHLCYYHNAVSDLDMFVNGANLEFLFRLFCSSEDMPKLIRVCDNAEELKWVDVRVSGYWILNLSVPDDTAAVYEVWKRYKYTALEWKIVRDVKELRQEENYKLIHVLYCQKMMEGGLSVELICKSGIGTALKDYDLSKTEEVQEVLDMVNKAFGSKVNSLFQNSLFEILRAGQAVGKVAEHGYIHRGYNEFLDQKSVL